MPFSQRFPLLLAPSELLADAEIVLEAFPELHTISLELRYANTHFSYESRPTLHTFFCAPHKRHYVVYIHQSLQSVRAPLHPQNLSSSAFQGVLAHELSHTIYYLNKSWFQLLGFILLYIFLPSFRKRIEHQTDYEALSRGFQSHLHEYVQTAHEHLPASILTHRDHYYLTPEDLHSAIPGDTYSGPQWLEHCLGLCNHYHSFLSFAFVTGMGTVIDTLLFLALHVLFGVLIVPSNAIAFMLAAVFNFFVSRTVTFQDNRTKTHKKLFRYLVVASLGLVLNTWAVWFAITQLSLSPFVSKLVAAFVAFLFSFTLNHLWTFTKRHAS